MYQLLQLVVCVLLVGHLFCLDLAPNLGSLSMVPGCGDTVGYGVLCQWWAKSGECEWNRYFMLQECRFSCGICAAMSRIPPPCGYGPANGSGLQSQGSGLFVHLPNYPLFNGPGLGTQNRAVQLNTQAGFGALPPRIAMPSPSITPYGPQPPPAKMNGYGKLMHMGTSGHGDQFMGFIVGGGTPVKKPMAGSGHGHFSKRMKRATRNKRQGEIGKCVDEIEGETLFGGNSAMIENTDLEMCQLACLTEQIFDCKGAVYLGTTRQCMLYEFNGITKPDRVLPANEGDDAVRLDITEGPVPECPPVPEAPVPTDEPFTDSPLRPITPGRPSVGGGGRCVSAEIPNQKLFGGNLAMRDGGTADQCQQACVNEVAFDCRAAVYIASTRGCLSYDFNDLDKPDRVLDATPAEAVTLYRVESGPNCPDPVGPPGPITPTPVPRGACDYDRHELCGFWAQAGQCTTNPLWMLPHCSASCLIVDLVPKAPPGTIARDDDTPRPPALQPGRPSNLPRRPGDSTDLLTQGRKKK